MNKPPRDLNAGLMAQLLSDSGAFGFEIDACMAYVYDGEIKFLAFAHEDDCVEECLRQYNRGNLVLDFEYYSEHIGGDESKEDAINAAYEKFETDEFDSFSEQVEAFGKLGFDSHEDEFAAYFATLTDEGKALVNGMLGIGLQRKWITPAFAETWRQPEPASPAGKRFAGFAYVKNGAVKYYLDAYLPDVWKKWRQTPDAGAIFVDYVEGSEPIFQLRKKFEARLQKLCDASYLAVFGAPAA